jgi:hypothetical protein
MRAAALHEVPWFSAVPQDLFIFIGVCEFLGGVGLRGLKPTTWHTASKRCRAGLYHLLGPVLKVLWKNRIELPIAADID